MIKANFKGFLGIIAGFALIFSAGCSLLPKEEQALRPPLVKPVKENLETFEVKKGTIVKRIRGMGNFEPTNIKYHQFTESGGRIKEVLVRSGDVVKKGDVLVQLEIEGLDLELKYKKLDLERAKLGVDQAKQNKDANQLKLKMMELEIAQLQYEKTLAKFNSRKLVAEMDGEVVFVEDKKPGSWVDTYLVLVSVADTKAMRISYQTVSAVDIQNAIVGMEVEVLFKGKNYIGRVSQTPSSAPVVDNQQLRDKYSRTLYVELPELPDEAKFGSSADINIVTEKREDTLVIPSRGLRTYFGRNYVQILDGESRTEVDIEKGIETPTEVEVLTGLKEGQLVILQ